MKSIKKVQLSLFIVCFFTMLCASQVHRSTALLPVNNSGKNYQKSEKAPHASFDLYNMSDDDHDESLLDEVEKVKFDLELIIERWISTLYESFYSSDKVLVTHHQPFTDVPKYILYHSLQIAYC